MGVWGLKDALGGKKAGNTSYSYTLRPRFKTLTRETLKFTWACFRKIFF